MDQALNSQKTPHTSPLRASYGMSFVSILMKNDRVIKGFYCTYNTEPLDRDVIACPRLDACFWHSTLGMLYVSMIASISTIGTYPIIHIYIYTTCLVRKWYAWNERIIRIQTFNVTCDKHAHQTLVQRASTNQLMCSCTLVGTNRSTMAELSCHYSDVIMGAMAFQIISFTIVNSTVYSGADQRKHPSSASLSFVRGIHWWPVNSPHKGPVTRKMFPFDDVIMS